MSSLIGMREVLLLVSDEESDEEFLVLVLRVGWGQVQIQLVLDLMWNAFHNGNRPGDSVTDIKSSGDLCCYESNVDGAAQNIGVPVLSFHGLAIPLVRLELLF